MRTTLQARYTSSISHIAFFGFCSQLHYSTERQCARGPFFTISRWSGESSICIHIIIFKQSREGKRQDAGEARGLAGTGLQMLQLEPGFDQATGTASSQQL